MCLIAFLSTGCLDSVTVTFHLSMCPGPTCEDGDGRRKRRECQQRQCNKVRDSAIERASGRAQETL